MSPPAGSLRSVAVATTTLEGEPTLVEGEPQVGAGRPRAPARRIGTQWAPQAIDLGAGVAALVSVAVAPLVALARAAGAGPAAPTATGVAGSLAAAANRAWRLDLLRGLPTGHGIAQLGPALGYVVAPFVHASSSATSGEDVGASVLALATLLAAVAAIWRRLGPQAALWVALVVDAWLTTIGPAVLRDASPGLVVVAPTAAIVILLAVSLVGVRGGWLWAAAFGSVVVQTRLTAALPIGGAVLLGGIAAMVAANGDDRMEVPVGWWRRPSRVAGLAVLALVWVPTVIEAFRDSPSNLRLLWSWWRNPHGVHVGLGPAFRHALTAAAMIPIGDRELIRNPGTLGLVAGGLVLAAVAVLAWWIARRRCSRTARGLVGLAAVAFVLAVLAFRRSPGPVLLRTDGWLAWIPLALLLALGVALLGPRGDPPLGPAGVKGAVKKLKKMIGKEKGRHYIPKFTDRGGGGRDPLKSEAKREKAAKKAARQGARRPLALEWSRTPRWLAIPLVTAALGAAGFATAGVSSGPPVRLPAVVPVSAAHHLGTPGG